MNSNSSPDRKVNLVSEFPGLADFWCVVSGVAFALRDVGNNASRADVVCFLSREHPTVPAEQIRVVERPALGPASLALGNFEVWANRWLGRFAA